MILEVIATSATDALEAERGGANRLELVRDLHVGGLTPELNLIREVLDSVSIPVRVMLRERNDFLAGDAREVQQLCSLAGEFSSLPVEGLVLGFVKEGKLDLECISKLQACAPNLKTTVHHAFEEVEPLTAIQEIKELKQVDRILTYGGLGDWETKIDRLLGYQKAGFPEIKLLVGGGLDVETIAMIAAKTSLREFHVGRAARHPPTVAGSVRREKVSALIEAMK